MRMRGSVRVGGYMNVPGIEWTPECDSTLGDESGTSGEKYVCMCVFVKREGGVAAGAGVILEDSGGISR